jgi:hypothetical protein
VRVEDLRDPGYWLVEVDERRKQNAELFLERHVERLLDAPKVRLASNGSVAST